MTSVLQPFHILVIALAGWLSRHQQTVIDYLIEENRVLKEQLEGQRLSFTDEQRIRLAVLGEFLVKQQQAVEIGRHNALPRHGSSAERVA